MKNTVNTLHSFIVKNWLYILAAIFILKLLIVPFTSEPFDFATYVYQVKKQYDFNFLILDNWNKSYFLLLLYKISYSAYINFIQLFHMQKDNVIALQVFFKIPFIFMDLLVGLVLIKILQYFQVAKEKIVYAVLFWNLNPLAWYSIYVDGQYEIAIVLMLLVSFYFLLKQKNILAFILLAIAFSLKYVFLILLPIYIIYSAQGIVERNKNMLKRFLFFCLHSVAYLFVFLATYVVNISPFIFTGSKEKTIALLSGHYTGVLGFLGSVVTNANNPTNDGPLYKILYYLLYWHNPRQSDHLYALWQNFFSVDFFAILLVGVSLFLLIKYIFLKKKFSAEDVLLYLFTYLAMFYLTQSKIEAHWYLWSVPFILALIFTKRLFALNTYFIAFTLFIPALFFGAGNQKWHFAHLATNFDSKILGWTQIEYSPFTSMFIFTVISILMLNLILFFFRKPKKIYNDLKNYTYLLGISTMVLVCIVALYFSTSIVLLISTEFSRIPHREASASQTWIYSLVYDKNENKMFIPALASNYIRYIFANYKQQLDNNMLLEVPDTAKLPSKYKPVNCPKNFCNGDKNYSFADIYSLFYTQNNRIYLNIPNITFANIRHTYAVAYGDPWLYQHTKMEEPYYLPQFTQEIIIQTWLYYIGVVAGGFLLWKGYKKYV